jgi:guanylate kinase
MTYAAAHNPDRPPPWLLELNTDSGLLNVRHRRRPPPDGFDVVFAFPSRDQAVELRDRLAQRGTDNRYRLRQPMTLAEARNACARTVKGAAA